MYKYYRKYTYQLRKERKKDRIRRRGKKVYWYIQQGHAQASTLSLFKIAFLSPGIMDIAIHYNAGSLKRRLKKS